MYCPSCGEEIPNDGEFCPRCGSEIEEEKADRQTVAETNQSSTDNSSGLIHAGGKVLFYLIGGFLILSGLAGLTDSVLAGLVILLGGIIALPIVRDKLNESQGIALGTWGTVIIVIISVVAGGALVGATGQNPSPESNAADPTEPVTTTEQQLIQKPATELVIQLDQFEAGWSGEVTGNETTAEGRYFQSQESAVVQTTAEKFDTVEPAVDEYAERVEEVQEQHATESVDVGDEGILYITSNTAWVIFRDANVVAEVRYTTEFGTDREETVREFTNKMYENFPQ